MKRLLYLGLAALMLPALVACQGEKAVKINWQEGEVMAVAFLGYYDSFAEFEASPSYIPLTETFPQIVGASQVLCGIGRELYLVVPRDPMATLAVNEAGEYVTDANREVFYRSEEGKPVLLLNNWYEHNSQVNCTDNDGHSATYYPGIDRHTGVLEAAPDGSVHDISLPMPKPLEGYTSFSYGEVFEGADIGLSVRLEAGQPILTCSAAPMTLIGYDEDSIVLADGDNTFDGINGRCKGVFLGDIGQDFNPVLCVLMENGDVKKCSIFYAMQHGGPVLSDTLPDFKDVTGFEIGGGGGWVDEETGETVYDYTTIYALDARGGRTEIPDFVFDGLYMAEDGDYTYEVTLTPDWNFYLSVSEKETGFLHELYNGSFMEEDFGDTVSNYSFHVRQYSHVHDGIITSEGVSRSGRFTTAERGLSYEVTLSGSDAIPSGLLFHEEGMNG